jgi:carboxymethylenebutenolidase
MSTQPAQKPQVKTEQVTLKVSDGTEMKAYVAHPATAPRGGMMVLQEAFGVNAHIRDVTERFAREGYLSIAPELFHRTGPGFEGSYSNFEAIMPHITALKNETMAADLEASFAWLEKTMPKKLKTAAIGYCMGGRAACLAALTVPVGCAISYYGGGIGPNPRFPALVDRLKDVKAPLLFFWGGLDKHIGQDQIQPVIAALKSANKTFVTVDFAQADHGFFCDERPSFNKDAAAQSWALTLSFLETHMK